MDTPMAQHAHLGTISGPRKAESGTALAAILRGRISAIASREPEDAVLTGMTRSLQRRLLALNLGPLPALTSRATALKVA